MVGLSLCITASSLGHCTYNSHHRLSQDKKALVLLESDPKKITFFTGQFCTNYHVLGIQLQDHFQFYASVGCVKPYTVVPKVLGLFLSTPNPIHLT